MKKDNNGSPYDSPYYRGYVLSILMLVYTFNFIDRQLLVILQEPLKADLGLSDTQLGLLTGFAFAVFYIVCGIPIARWADKGNRRNIVSIALVLWSAMTALSGFVQNFVQLLLVRIGVAVGESGGTPPSHSMISDIFPLEKRATAFSVYSLGINLGVLVGFMIGGWIGQYYGWRIAFLAFGIPGILLAVILRFTVQEPPRGWSQGIPDHQNENIIPVLDVLKLLWSRKTFRHLALAGGLQAFVAFSFWNWLPSYLVRQYDVGLGELGTWLGLTMGIAGGLGTLAGGHFADKFSSKDKRWYLWIPAGSILLTLPAQIMMLLMDDLYLVLLLNIVPSFLFNMYLGSILAVTHGLVGVRMRALSSAILLFVLNLIGLGLGPVTVGFLSDLFAPTLGQDSLRYAMMLSVCVAALWCSFHYLMAARTVREELSDAPA